MPSCFLLQSAVSTVADADEPGPDLPLLELGRTPHVELLGYFDHGTIPERVLPYYFPKQTPK